ncbi:MAG: peptidylprolyl isomerase [Gammaproteobacteria bacterium]|nr:peptidylprolyl isomerase [Gammaproteobacteria bacterium]
MEKIQLRDITVEATPVAKTDQFDADQLAPGKTVRMHFELSLPGGEIIDSNFEGNAVEFTVGDGNLLPGFEQSIFGLQENDEHTVEIPPSEAFGDHNEDNIQVIPRFRFPADLVVEKGLMINFADSAGNEQAGVIANFDADRVTVDFNHPLAGKNILFRVRILSIH